MNAFKAFRFSSCSANPCAAFVLPKAGVRVAPTDFLGEAGTFLATTAVSTDIVDIIAGEMALGVDRAVEFWMSQIERALTDPHLTSLGRLSAVRGIVDDYKDVTGKVLLQGRAVAAKDLLEKVC